MSTALAIASVTAVLRDLLNDGLIDHDVSASVGNVEVTALPPDRLETGTSEKSLLNIYMYRAEPSAAWRNRDLPSRDRAGERTASPALALDLHYLLSAYGNTDLHGDILLGYAMQLLHETPVLGRRAIRDSLIPSPTIPSGPNPGLSSALRDLATSQLAEQVELVKITPHPMGAEEMSRLWSAMQAKYRPSMTYTASTVLIESRRRVRAALPVRAREVHVAPMRRPHLAEVAPAIVTSGGTITLRGTDLAGAETAVRLGDQVVSVAFTGDMAIQLTVPAALRAGVHVAQVTHHIRLGTPPTPRVAAESNVLPFALAPQVTISPASVARGGTLTVTVTPPVARDQRATLLLGAIAIPIADRTAADPATASSFGVTVPADAPTGQHLVRLDVDDVRSLLTTDAAGTQFAGPVVTVT